MQNKAEVYELIASAFELKSKIAKAIAANVSDNSDEADAILADVNALLRKMSVWLGTKGN